MVPEPQLPISHPRGFRYLEPRADNISPFLTHSLFVSVRCSGKGGYRRFCDVTLAMSSMTPSYQILHSFPSTLQLWASVKRNTCTLDFSHDSES
jgi:hypothetical protein